MSYRALLEYLSDASLLVKLLVFPANVRLDWKVIARYKHSSLFGFIDSDEGKMFYNIDTCRTPKSCKDKCSFGLFIRGNKKEFIRLTPSVNVINLFSSLQTMRPNKLKCLCLAFTFQSSLTFAGNTRSLPKKEHLKGGPIGLALALPSKFQDLTGKGFQGQTC